MSEPLLYLASDQFEWPSAVPWDTEGVQLWWAQSGRFSPCLGTPEVWASDVLCRREAVT